MDPLPKMDDAPRIALFVDSPLRDLPGLCLLALELSGRGCKVFLMPMYLNEEVFALAPDFVLVNYLRKASQGIATHMISNHIQFGVLDTEGGPVFDMENSYLPLLCTDPHVNRSVSVVCCWGPELAGIVARSEIYPPQTVEITGSPRFDLYAPPWRKAMADFPDSRPENGEDFILVCSNFGLTNSHYGDDAKIKDSLVRVHHYAPEKVDKMMKDEKVVIGQFVETIRGVAQHFPKRRFVFRPHPFESTAFFEKLFVDLPNVSVIKRGTVAGWMMNAKTAIQLNCTTSYDAWFAGTPSLRLAGIVQETGLGEDSAINHPCADLAELISTLESIEAGRFQVSTESAEASLAMVRRFFGEPDGQAHQRVADRILERLDLGLRPKRFATLRKIRHASALSASKLPRRLIGWLTALSRLAGFQLIWNFWNLKSRRAWVAKHDASEKSFDVAQVRKIMETLAACQGVAAPRIARSAAVGEFAFGGLFSRTIAVLPASKNSE